MNDKHNELHSHENGLNDAQSRAERIKAIKKSIQWKSEESEKNSIDSIDTVREPVKKASEPKDIKADVTSGETDWENEIADRIAKRVQKMKAEKNTTTSATPESIINDLDNKSYENSVEYVEETDEKNDLKSVLENAEDINEISEENSEIPAEEIPIESAESSKKTKNKKEKNSIKDNLLNFIPQKKDSMPERIRKIIFLGSVVAIVCCGYVVADYYIDNARTQSGYDDVMSEYSAYVPDTTVAQTEDDGIVYTLLPGAEKLLQINSEVAGVLNIPGTDVNYPVMQSDDLEKYLTKNITGEEAKAGSLFFDYRNKFDHVVDGKLTDPNSDNLIIYGHNMENGMMFGTLKEYRNNSYYYGEHPIIELNSNYACYQYKIFAFFIIDAVDTTDTAFECWNQLNFTDETEFYNFVNEAKRRTIRLNDVDVKYGDKLLTLSTCNGIFGSDGGGRMIVMARLVRDGEDPYEGTQNSTANPNIKWPTLYYKYNKNEKYDPDAEFVPYGESTEEEITTEE